MKRYYLNDFENKETYIRFIEYMVLNSDSFSLIYFKYRENEKYTTTVKEIQTLLKPYKIFAKRSTQWPSMITLNENNHIYKLVLYKSTVGVEKILSTVEKLFDWDYPSLPMDLCFYKDGYAWLVSSSHERCAFLCIDDKKSYFEFIDIGAKLHFKDEIDKSQLFLEESL